MEKTQAEEFKEEIAAHQAGDANGGGYSRAQFAAAVDRAHELLHSVADLYSSIASWTSPDGANDGPLAEAVAKAFRLVDQAHKELHNVGAGSQRSGCLTVDPEVRQVVSEFTAKLASPLPCGHTIGDLVSGAGQVTKCGACLKDKQEGRMQKSHIKPTIGHLNETSPRADAWRFVLGGLDVPLESPVSVQAELPNGRHEVFRLDIAKLTAEQRQRLISHLSAKFSIKLEEVAERIDADGVPILAEDVIVTFDARLVL